MPLIGAESKIRLDSTKIKKLVDRLIEDQNPPVYHPLSPPEIRGELLLDPETQSIIQAAFTLLNRTNPNLAKDCWLCLRPGPLQANFLWTELHGWLPYILPSLVLSFFCSYFSLLGPALLIRLSSLSKKESIQLMCVQVHYQRVATEASDPYNCCEPYYEAVSINSPYLPARP